MNATQPPPFSRALYTPSLFGDASFTCKIWVRKHDCTCAAKIVFIRCIFPWRIVKSGCFRHKKSNRLSKTHRRIAKSRCFFRKTFRGETVVRFSQWFLTLRNSETRGQWPFRLASYDNELMISYSKLGLRFEIRSINCLDISHHFANIYNGTL